jgi:hypothetical protein
MIVSRHSGAGPMARQAVGPSSSVPWDFSSRTLRLAVLTFE